MLKITAAIFAATMFTSSTTAIRLVEGEDTKKPLPTNIEIEGLTYCYLTNSDKDYWDDSPWGIRKCVVKEGSANPEDWCPNETEEAWLESLEGYKVALPKDMDAKRMKDMC